VDWAPTSPSSFRLARVRESFEHVSPDDPGADTLDAACGETVIGARRSILGSEHSPKGPGGKHPLMERDATDAQWIREVLVRSRTKAVEGHRDTMHAQLGHLSSFHSNYPSVGSRPA
jgi:hypothetical protein